MFVFLPKNFINLVFESSVDVWKILISLFGNFSKRFESLVVVVIAEDFIRSFNSFDKERIREAAVELIYEKIRKGTTVVN